MTTDELIKALLASKTTPVEEPKKKKRKRGGLAGIWDRNKKVIKPLATGLAGALTGGAAVPALLGGVMGGLDREGKSGIGLDLGGAAKGAVGGAAAGMAGAGLKGALAAKAKSGLMSAGARGAMGDYMSTIPGMGKMGTAMAGGGGAAGGAAAGGGGGLMSALNKYATPIGMGLQGAAGILGQQSERSLRERQMQMEQEELNRRRMADETRAALLGPLFQDVMKQRFG